MSEMAHNFVSEKVLDERLHVVRDMVDDRLENFRKFGLNPYMQKDEFQIENRKVQSKVSEIVEKIKTLEAD